jgi:hypothetical protein
LLENDPEKTDNSFPLLQKQMRLSQCPGRDDRAQTITN